MAWAVLTTFLRSSWFKIALHDHGNLGVKHRTACQAAPDGLVDLHRIRPGLDGHDKGLGHDSDSIIYNDLIGQLCDAAASRLANMKSR